MLRYTKTINMEFPRLLNKDIFLHSNN